MFWGAILCPSFVWFSSLNFDHIYNFCLKRPAGTRPYLGLMEVFCQKRSPMIVVLCWTKKFLNRNYASSQLRWRPNNCAEKQPKLGKNGTLCGGFVGVLPSLGGDVVSPRQTHHSTQNYNCRWAFLKNMSVRRRYGGLNLGFWNNTSHKLEDRIRKGGKMLHLKKIQNLY